MHFYNAVLAFLLLAICKECKADGRNNLLTNRNFMEVIQNSIPTQSKHEIVTFSQLAKDIKTQMLRLSTHFKYTGLTNDTCKSALETWTSDLLQNKTYAIKMVDAWGKPESGIFQGNLHWLGRYYECEAISNQDSGINGQWCSGAVGPSSAPTPISAGKAQISLGMCFPESCSSENITDLFKGILHVLNKSTEITVDCPPPPHNWDAITTIWVVISSILFILVILATAADMYRENLIKESIDMSEYQPLMGSQPQVEQTVAWKYLSTFSLSKNTTSLLSTEKKAGNIHCLHGIRFISMTWVVLGHTAAFGFTGADNMADAADFAVNHLSFMAIISGTFSVDTFFFLSGLLVAFLGLREMDKENGKIHIFKMYLHRYLRLTPAYAFCILLSVSIFVVIGDGPLWHTNAYGMKEVCSQYWWTNLLYINNLYPVELGKECYGWGWYLANDMQFYLVAPLFLVLLYRRPKIGVAALSIGTLCSIAITGALSNYYGEMPVPQTIVMAENPVAMAHRPSPKGNATGSEADKFASDIYAKPWCRVGVYFIGMITGYILHATKGQIRMNKLAVFLGWFLTAVMELALVYGGYFKMHKGVLASNNVNALFNAVSRPLWAVGLGWVVIACVSGHGGIVDRFLSWKVFIPLSRMTYAAYLLHILVLDLLILTPEVTMHFSILSMVSMFLSAVVLTHGVAYLLTMLVEIPLLNVQNVAFPRKKTTKAVPVPGAEENGVIQS